jgi:hypothetical protein
MGRAIDHDDAAAIGEQRLHDRAAHGSSRAGDQRHLVLQ